MVIEKQATNLLTGLANQIGLAQAIKNTKRPVIALMDINGCNALSNFYGAKTVDAIIIKLANYLSKIISNDVSIFHINHDQFVLMIDNDKTDININKIVSNTIAHFKENDLLEQGVKINISLFGYIKYWQ